MKGRMPLLVAALLCAAPAAWAQPTKAGAQFKVNACANCTHTLPAVAGTPSGRFLAVWEGSHATDPRGILARFFEPNGAPKGADVVANARVVAPDQYDPSVAADRKGEYVVVWSSYTVDNDGDIVAQRFKADGKPLGNPIQVNVDDRTKPVPTDDFSPAVAKAADGGFVVVWLSLLPPNATTPGTPPDVYSRRFNAAGAPLGPQVKLSGGLVSGDRPDVCIDGLGRSIVSWTSVDKFEPFEPSLRGVTVRRLNPAGGVLGRPIIVAPPIAQAAPSSVTCTGNLFVVVWQSELAPGGERNDILGRRYTPAGRPAAGGVFRINSAVAGDQRLPAVSASPTGHFVVVWTSKLNDDVVRVMGRRYGPNAAPLGLDFVIDPSLADRSRPAEPEISHVGNAGNFVVVWRDGAGGLFGQRYTP